MLFFELHKIEENKFVQYNEDIIKQLTNSNSSKTNVNPVTQSVKI